MFDPEVAQHLAYQARIAQLRAERDALRAAIPGDVSRPLGHIDYQYGQVTEQLDQLRHGRYQGDDGRLVERADQLREATS
jgi:hypothetical protein